MIRAGLSQCHSLGADFVLLETRKRKWLPLHLSNTKLSRVMVMNSVEAMEDMIVIVGESTVFRTLVLCGIEPGRCIFVLERTASVRDQSSP